MKALLSTTYFGPIQWYQKLYRAEHVVIEQWESFQKQTYRNRCLIATTQGIQALTVPVVRGETSLMKDIRISDHGNWRHLHWNAHRVPMASRPSSITIRMISARSTNSIGLIFSISTRLFAHGCAN